MFCESYNIEYLDLSNFNTEKVTDMQIMFNRCFKLKKIKGINNYNTENVTNMEAIFRECNEIKILDLTNFNTTNVSDMTLMFNKCYKLKEIKGIKYLIQLMLLI